MMKQTHTNPRIVFCSRRLFADGPLEQPLAENDPVNIAYALQGDYLNFYTVKKMSDEALTQKLSAYALVILALETEELETVSRIAAVCPGRLATYSEGHIYNYQQLPPMGQAIFVNILRQSKINFIYWEKYLPFYQALSAVPAAYLPYPFPIDFVRRKKINQQSAPKAAILPTGLSGGTRNGLASLIVGMTLMQQKQIDTLKIWLTPATAAQDARAIEAIVKGEEINLDLNSVARKKVLNPTPTWRERVATSGIDYRLLLRLKEKIFPKETPQTAPVLGSMSGYQFFTRSHWQAYLEQLATAALLIDLNNRETVGRNALDCAALGIPSISTNRSDLQEKLFPKTTLDDCWDIAGAVELSTRVLADTVFRAEIIQSAEEELAHFSWDTFRHRFTTLRQQYRLFEVTA